MITAALVEDDAAWSATVREYVKKFSAESGTAVKLTCFGDAETFLTACADFDLVLMDIELPGMNGMDAAKKLREAGSGAALLFVTNMAQFALNGYEVDAVDFIVKPVPYFVFSVKFRRAAERAAARKYTVLRVKTDAGTVNLRSSDIKYVEIIKHYTVYHTTDGDYRARGALKDVEPALAGYDFVRCNNCYLVNLKYVKGVRGYTVNVGGDELLISHPKRRGFVRALNDYLGTGNDV